MHKQNGVTMPHAGLPAITMKNMKRITALILCLIFALSAFTGCASDAQKSEALNAFKELYPKSVEINEIIYGEGLPASKTFTAEEFEALSSPHYVPVAESSPYKTEKELKEAILAVYTQDYYNDVLKNTAFEGYGETGSEPPPRYKEVDGVLYVNVKFMGYNLTGKRLVDETTVRSVKHGVATLKTPYIPGGEKNERVDKVLTMIFTESGWRFDDPTF